MTVCVRVGGRASDRSERADLFLQFEAECPHGCFELSHVHGSRVVGIEEVECFLDLFQLFLRQRVLKMMMCVCVLVRRKKGGIDTGFAM